MKKTSEFNTRDRTAGTAASDGVAVHLAEHPGMNVTAGKIDSPCVIVLATVASCRTTVEIHNIRIDVLSPTIPRGDLMKVNDGYDRGRPDDAVLVDLENPIVEV